MLRALKKIIFTQKRRQSDSTSKLYRIGIFDCYLPAMHKLPSYQANYKTYDNYYGEWLEIVERHSIETVSFLDIGANVGDTALYVLSHLNCQVTAIEPSSLFFQYLSKNIKENNLEKFVSLHKIALVLPGKASEVIKLFNDGSTASTSLYRQSNYQHVELVETMELSRFLSEKAQVYDLVKIDIDSNDYAFVSQLINNYYTNNAVICFEFDPINLESGITEEVSSLFEELERLEYSSLIVDNHGRAMLPTKNLKETIQYLGNWVKLQQVSGVQHVHYFDVWIFPSARREIFKEITRSILSTK